MSRWDDAMALLGADAIVRPFGQMEWGPDGKKVAGNAPASGDCRLGNLPEATQAAAVLDSSLRGPVLDADSTEAAEALHRILQELELAYTVVSTPRGGSHFYLNGDGAFTSQSVDGWAEKVDFRSPAGSGKKYLFIPGSRVKGSPQKPGAGWKIAERVPGKGCTEDTLKSIRKQHRQQVTPTFRETPEKAPEANERPVGPSENPDSPVTTGGRNNYLTKVAGKLRKIGIGEAAIETSLHDENRRRCSPPLGAEEVRTIARSIGNKQSDNEAAAETHGAEIAASLLAARKPKIWRGDELMAHEFPAQRWAIPGILPAGLTILGGTQKLGKSWMLLGWAIEIDKGGHVFHTTAVDSGRVLYLALEDTPRRLRNRLEKLRANPSARLEIATEWSRGAEGINELGEYLNAHDDIALVAVDTWGRFAKVKDGNEYNETNDAAAALKKLADSHDVPIVAVHHLKKATSHAVEDFTERLMGSNGLAAAADTIMVLARARGKADATLEITGRDVEEKAFALQFDAGMGTWAMLGDASEMQATGHRQQIYDYVKANGPVGPAEVARETGLSPSTVKHAMPEMARAGTLNALGGAYEVPA